MRKKKIPLGTFDDRELFNVKRSYPSLECLTTKQQKELESRVRKLIDFESKARVSFQVTDYVSKRLSGKAGFVEKNILDNCNGKKEKYFFKDPWESSSMIIVKEGEKPITEGFHLIVSHGDSPCLHVKPKPLRIEWDPDEIYNYLGVRFSAIGQGGISNHQWVGQQVNVVGYFLDKGKEKRKIEFPGVVGDFSGHIDYRTEENVKEAFPSEQSLEIIVGHTGFKDTLERLNLKCEDDLAQTRLWAVPVNEPLLIDEYKWNLLVGYGHDNKTGVFSAVNAIINTKKPKYTSMVWITDKEESGDTSPSGAEGPFLDLVVEYLVEKEEVKRGKSVSERERKSLYLKSSVIIGDVNIAPYGPDAENMDYFSSAKIGFGAVIAREDGSWGSHPNLIRKIREIVNHGKNNGGNICHQICGEFYDQDKEDLKFTDSLRGYLIPKGVPFVWVGVPCASSHSHNEIICPADEYWTSKLYQRFFESNIGIEE